jgi:hypothetical protein
MVGAGRAQPASAADFDHAATRLLAAILAGRVQDAAFTYRVEAGLVAALELLDREPRLAAVLLAEAGRDPLLRERQERWATSFAELLRDAGSQSGELRPPPGPAEPQLICSLREQLRRALRSSEGSGLLDRLPGALEVILLHYMDRSQAAPIVSACRASLAEKRERPPRRGGFSGQL